MRILFIFWIVHKGVYSILDSRECDYDEYLTY